MTRLLVGLIFLCCTITSFAEEHKCNEVAATARMARATTDMSLSNIRKLAGNTYRANLVFVYRIFQLHKRKIDAERLLTSIPKNDAEQTIVLTLGDALCDAEPVRDMLTLSKVNEGIGRELANAVILAPDLMQSYVLYSLDAVQDPHSDYAIQMRRVCQQTRHPFVESVKKLAPDKKKWFAEHVMNPESCKPLAIPES